MSMDSKLPQIADDPVEASMSIRMLHGKCIAKHIVLRLLHIWFSDEYIGVHNNRFMYTLWLDKEGSLAEGVTDKDDIAHMQNLLQVNALHVMKDVPLTKARRTHRTTPADLRFYLCRGQSCTPVDENTFQGTFLLDNFKNTEFDDLLDMVTDPTHLADLTGRVLSISKPIHNVDGTILIVTKIENTRKESGIINYITNNDDFYNWAGTSEMSGPVVVTFTSILASEPEPNSHLVLTSTAATRCVRGSYTHRYRPVFDRFFHDHKPIKILEDPPSPYIGFLRHPLPCPATLCKTYRLLQSGAINPGMRYWCLAQIHSVSSEHIEITNVDNNARYNASVNCTDLLYDKTIKFSHNAMVQLLRLPAEEFEGLDALEKVAVLEETQGRCVTLELEIAGELPDMENVFVSTLWSPVALNVA